MISKTIMAAVVFTTTASMALAHPGHGGEAASGVAHALLDHGFVWPCAVALVALAGATWFARARRRSQ